MTILAFAESIQLVPDGTLFLHIAIILLMVYVLNKTLFKPLNRTLEEREQHTHGRTGEARGILQRVDESLSKYERSLRDARAQSYRLLEQQQTEAAEVRRQKLGQVRDEVEGLIEEQKGAIRAQAEEARASLENDARQVAATVSAQILRRPV